MNKSNKKVFIKQTFIIVLGVLLMFFIIFKSSFAILNNDIITGNNDILIKTGSLQVVLNTSNEIYNLKDEYKNPVSDIVGMEQEGYSFSIRNTGSIDIGYYEVRIIDQENKVTTLPHKYIKYAIKKDNGDFESPKNLGDSKSIIYSGTDLKVGESINLLFKMWISDDTKSDVWNKSLHIAIEVTLYQKYEDNYYISYNANGGIDAPLKSEVYLKKIREEIPKRNGYTFLGWALSKDSNNVSYHPGDDYLENKGILLFAKWQKD